MYYYILRYKHAKKLIILESLSINPHPKCRFLHLLHAHSTSSTPQTLAFTSIVSSANITSHRASFTTLGQVFPGSERWQHLRNTCGGAGGNLRRSLIAWWSELGSSAKRGDTLVLLPFSSHGRWGGLPLHERKTTAKMIFWSIRYNNLRNK